MSITFDAKEQIFTLHTRRSTYQMGLGCLGHLLHYYYGPRAEGGFDYLFLPHDCGFSPNPYEMQDDRGRSLDLLGQEYSVGNGGDFRLSCLDLSTEHGQMGADLRYVSHEIRPGKYALGGLPAAFDRDSSAETLAVTLRDAASGLEAELLYGVYEAYDVITRAARLKNRGEGFIRLEKAASACLDVPFGEWDFIHFDGRHTMERQLVRTPLLGGIQTVSSRRGLSGHQHNPFTVLCARNAGEDFGSCYGIMPVYSGNHRTDAETDQMGLTRLVAGINGEGFSWTLESGEDFETPEVLLSYSGSGLGELSRQYHRFIRERLCRSAWAVKKRPVLLNSWEAAYFDFDADRLLALARETRDLGAELFVLDDGWFGDRQDDRRALGDWFPNKAKLPGGLKNLVSQIKDMGLKFGLWIEPEMVSEDSGLYRAHPDWALRVPGRPPSIGRNQLVLDLGRREIAGWVYETVAGLLREYGIDYIKWDMNRALTDLYSLSLPPERQGEAAHRYMLGLYSVMHRLTAEYPEVLFEGCAGGGGRFDAGILAYFPQIWCSDNTDAVSRLSIQEGTGCGYPMSAVCAHVSACPNHQTCRTVPLETRALVAMAGGSFGYELDPGRLSAEEKEAIRRQISRYHEIEHIVLEGDLYRLEASGGLTAWQTVSADGREALVTAVLPRPESNQRPLHILLKGLEPNGSYTLRFENYAGCVTTPERERPEEGKSVEFTGAALMHAGLVLPPLFGDCPGAQLLFERI